MNNYFVDIESDEFKQLLENEVNRAVKRLERKNKYSDEDLLTPEQACEELRIFSKEPNKAIRHKTNPRKYRYPLKATKGLARTYLYRYKDIQEFKKKNDF